MPTAPAGREADGQADRGIRFKSPSARVCLPEPSETPGTPGRSIPAAREEKWVEMRELGRDQVRDERAALRGQPAHHPDPTLTGWST